MKCLWTIILISCGSLSSMVSAQELDYRSFLGKSPPELTNPDATWLGAKVGRKTLASMKGHTVIWLEFGFLH